MSNKGTVTEEYRQLLIQSTHHQTYGWECQYCSRKFTTLQQCDSVCPVIEERGADTKRRILMKLLLEQLEYGCPANHWEIGCCESYLLRFYGRAKRNRYPFSEIGVDCIGDGTFVAFLCSDSEKKHKPIAGIVEAVVELCGNKIREKYTAPPPREWIPGEEGPSMFALPDTYENSLHGSFANWFGRRIG
jgi:hypothetical protein